MKVEESTTVSDDLRNSIESLESKDEAPKPDAGSESAPAATPPAPAAKPAAALATSATPAKDPAQAATEASAAKAVAATAASTAAAAVAIQPPADALKPPQSWKPDMRERWGTLSKEVQGEILRREKEITQGLQEASESRRFHQAFNQVAAPYQAYIAMRGGNPLAAFGDHLRTATLLRHGTDQEKAAAIAGAIGEYGINVQLLDAALAARLRGQPMPGGGQQQGQQFRDPRVDALLAQQDEAARTAVGEEIAAFAGDAKNEFYQDVKMEMADLLEFNAQRGVKMTIQQAYDKACKNSDSIQATLTARKQATDAAAANKKVAAARAAVTGGPGLAAPAAGVPAKTGDSMRDDLTAAIDRLSDA